MLELTHYGICSSDGQQNKDGEISVPPHGLLDKHCPGIHVDLSIKVITIISTSIEFSFVDCFFTKHNFSEYDFIALICKSIDFKVLKQKERSLSSYGYFCDDVG